MRFMHNLSEWLTLAKCISPQTIASATTVNGSDVNRQGYMAALFFGEVATFTGTQLTVKIQEADDDGTGAADTYADVPGAFLNLTTTTTTPFEIAVDLQPRKKFVRAVAVTTGGSVSIRMDTKCLLGGVQYSNSVAGQSF